MSLLQTSRGKHNNGPYHLSAHCPYHVVLQSLRLVRHPGWFGDHHVLQNGGLSHDHIYLRLLGVCNSVLDKTSEYVQSLHIHNNLWIQA